MISRYPAMVLTPILSFWTLGPVNKNRSSRSCCGYGSRSDSIIGVSFFYTTLNAIISISCGLFCTIFTYKNFFNFDSSRCYVYGGTTDCDLFLIGTTIISPLLFVACICILFLRFWKLQCCGVPLTNKKNFDVNALDDHQNEEHGLEMRETWTLYNI